MFLLIYENYERDLKKELWLCHKHMDLSMDEIMKMPIQDRKYYVRIHNKILEEEKNAYKKSVKHK